ncbi:MAG: hypothetical protein EOM52_05985 [Clostridia bacterium]|nr:hypothetical protein [Clostridia bacterium]
MDENKPGKRLAPGEGMTKDKKRVVIICCAAVLALVMVYLALCAYVSAAGTILPRVSYQGVDLGGMTGDQAAAALDQAASARFGAQTATITYTVSGDERTAQISGSAVGFNTGAVSIRARDHGRTSGFFAQGFYLLSTLITGYEVEQPLAFTDEAAVDAVVEEIAAALRRDMTETTHAIQGDALVFHMGVSGVHPDLPALKDQILGAFDRDGSLNLVAAPVVEAPPFPDLDAVHTEVYAEMADARLDPDTKKIVPAVVGVDFDVETARGLLEQAAEGSDCSVPLTLTQPRISTETLTASLFRDVLGEATSRVGGSANRKYNVKLSAQACGEQILLPGDVFSYNTATGSRSADKGYLPAPAYVNGLSVDELGGGICQTSSTIYYATLKSNLKIVERKNHMYAVGYVPDGMDATVYYGSLDFRFENNTAYPIKIVTESYDKSSSRYLTVKIMGTKTDDTYVKMTNKEISSITPETVYRADPTVPKGGAPKADPQSTAYRGRKVEAYRNLYSADGALISSTLESVNTYKKRDRVLLVNPEDLASYQTVGLPSATPVPSATPTPDVDPTAPVISTPQVPAQSPAVTEPPATPPVEPAPTPLPSATPAPDNGIPTLTPPPGAAGAAERSN